LPESTHPQSTQIDGATIEEALGKVREAFGSGARILGAEKVRSGGVAGFFAKERVELTVEVDRTAAPPNPAPAPPAEPVASPSAPSGPFSLLDLADSVSDAEYAGSQPAPVSTENTSFASVLRRIAGEAELAVAAQTAGDPPAPVTPEPVEEPAETGTTRALAAFTALARRNPSRVKAPDIPMPEPEPEVTPSFAASARSDIDSDAAFSANEPELLPEEPPAPVPSTAVEAVAAPNLPVPPLATDLQRLGLPGQLVPVDLDGNLFEALVRRFERLPAPPTVPRAKGTVLAVVGPIEQAMEIARELAVDARTHPREIVICESDDPSRVRGVRGGRRKTDLPEHLRLSGIDEAEEHRRSWRRRLEPTVVVIDAGINPTDATWARDIVAVLEPHSVWGVVDGGRKVEDLAAWSDDLGGLDALAVTGVADTLTPASVLHLGLPVGLVDGEPASPMLWAELLLDRIAA
jgi:hypothetical protein